MHVCMTAWSHESRNAWAHEWMIPEWLSDLGTGKKQAGLWAQEDCRSEGQSGSEMNRKWNHDYDCMSGWLTDWLATNSLSQIFAKPPLHWATSSIIHLPLLWGTSFSQLLLLWGADYLANVFSDPLLPWATALSYFLSRTPLPCVYEPPVQLQSRKALGSQHAQKLSVWQPGSGYSAFSNF